jgi:DNA-binding IscR family transcriptional regulator
LNRVLQALVRAGVVASQPGPHGGYSLIQPPHEITILKVINAVGPLDRIRSCPLGLSSHSALCPLHQELDNAFAAVERAFDNVTLADVANRPSRIQPLCDIGTTAARANGRNGKTAGGRLASKRQRRQK